MTRDGRLLELIVKQLQSTMVPSGVKVTSPEIFTKNGKRIGEIDITLRGRFGSSEIFVGIECRDRPRDGAQGIPWIRELKGKQDQLKIDKVVAVSSTGFKPDAIQLAQELGIDTMVVGEASDVDVKQWFQPTEFILSYPQYYLENPITFSVQDEFNSLLDVVEADLHISFLLRDEHTPPVNLVQYVEPEVVSIINKRPSGTVPHEFSSVLEYRNIEGVVNGKRFDIHEMKIPVVIYPKVIKGKVLMSSLHNAGDKGFVGLVGVCRCKVGERELRVLFTQDKPGKSSLKVAMLQDDGKPFFPEGTHIEFSVVSGDWNIGYSR